MIGAFIFRHRKAKTHLDGVGVADNIGLDVTMKILQQDLTEVNPTQQNTAAPPERRPITADELAALPAVLVAEIARFALLKGLRASAIAQGLRAAAEFETQEVRRCGSCYRWTGQASLPVVAFADGQIHVCAYCPRCERRHGSDAATVRRRILPYIRGERGGR